VQDSVATESGHTRHRSAILSLFLTPDLGDSGARNVRRPVVFLDPP
jgi:hypothetical protein